jgi:hypothetical protein
MTKKLKPREKPHYVNNKEFSAAVVEYVNELNHARDNGLEEPVINNYIASCFMRISNGLSHKPNFVRYTYKEEMVMDAVENCLKAIGNYNVEAATRSGNPNAFSYFTQICYFAFVRRIKKEKRQADIKMDYIDQMGVDMFIEYGELGQDIDNDTTHYVDSLKERISNVKVNDQKLKEFDQSKEDDSKKNPTKKKQLEIFMGFDIDEE